MPRLTCLLGCLTLTLGLVASCGESDGGSASIQSFFPADNEVSSWVEDQSTGQPGVEIYRTKAAAEAVIDGDVEPFAAHDFVAFARQHYVKDSYHLELRIWQMQDAAACTTLYDDLAASESLYQYPWESVTAGAGGRIASTGVFWWVNAHAGAYYVEAKVNQVSPPDQTARDEVVAFAQAVVAKIH